MNDDYKKGYADAMGWKTENHLEHLPQRTWVGLTDEEQLKILWDTKYPSRDSLMRAVEAKLKEKNT